MVTPILTVGSEHASHNLIEEAPKPIPGPVPGGIVFPCGLIGTPGWKVIPACATKKPPSKRLGSIVSEK